jgi:alcohol dehydrogenase YqhD (iron-dependent ADH family)
MKSFEYSFPTKLICGQRNEATFKRELFRLLGGDVLIVTSRNRSHYIKTFSLIIEVLEEAKSKFVVDFCDSNPSCEYLYQLSRRIMDGKKLVIALGGGSVIDAVKAASLQAANPDIHSLWHLEEKYSFNDSQCKIIAIPTTIGTGSEGNGTFIVYNYDLGQKRAFFNLSVRPALAWLDPDNVMSLSRLSLENGLIDCFSHFLEQYIRRDDSDLWSDYAIKGLLEFSIKCYDDLDNWSSSHELRSNVQMLSLLAMSYLFAQGKRLDWSLHNRLDRLECISQCHSAAIRCYLPAWLDEVRRDESLQNRFTDIAFVSEFVRRISA